MEKHLDLYKQYRKRLKAYYYMMGVVGWDSETVAPIGCFEERGKQMGVMAEEVYNIQTDKEFIDAINYLYDNKDELDEVLRHEIINQKKELDKTLKIPMQEIIDSQILFSSSSNIWAQAKKDNDFKKFEDTLEKIVSFKRRYIKYLETDDLKGYNVLLDEFEEGMTIKEYDLFFDLLKEKLVPFVKKVLEKGNGFNTDFASKKYKVEDQKKICEYFRDVLCFDKNHGIMMESEHPFTSGFGKSDVRITVHYYEKEFLSSIYSVIHETGHALYEANVSDELNDTFLNGGASMAMHESQSRFYENVIGRDKAFLEKHYPFIKSVYKKNLKDVCFEDFYKLVNKVEASYIRTEADELTYPLHIMLRYEIEKKLMDGSIEVKDLEKEWNKLFFEYFGIKVKKASQGVLQDVHWSGGSFGYFPTYALGSAYACQFLNAMKKDINFEEALKKDNTLVINEWLKDKIHKYGASKSPKELMKIASGEEFNPQYYVNYLIDKYSKIYNIQ